MEKGSNWKGFCGDSEFWAPSLLPNGTQPILTPCFQQTLLSWIPLIYLWLLGPFYIHHMNKSRKGSVPLSYLFKTKMVFGAVLILVALIEVSYAIAEVIMPSRQIGVVFLLTPLLTSLTLMFTLLLSVVGRLKGVYSSWVLFIFWFLLALCSLPEFIIKMWNSSEMVQVNLVRFVLFIIFYAFVLLQFFVSGLAEKKPYLTNPCPEENASIPSKLTFAWLSGLVFKGYRRTLTADDLWPLMECNRASLIMPRFLKAWNKQQTKAALSRSRPSPTSKCKKTPGSGIPMKKLDETDGHANNDDAAAVTYSGTRCPSDGSVVDVSQDTKPCYQASVFRAIVDTFGGYFFLGSFLKVLHDALLFVSPQLLRQLIQFTENESAYAWEGYMYAVLMFLTTLIQSALLNQYFKICMVTGMRLRTAIIGSVYRKALILSNSARKNATTGEIVNIMSVDAQRLLDLCTFVNTLWSSPLQILVALYFLWGTLGPSVLAGYAAMVIFIPLNAFIAIKIRALQAKQMKEKDARLKLMNEVLSGIKVLKLYAWETSFRQKVMEIRDREVKLLRRSSYLQAIMTFVWTSAPFVVALISFTVYVLIDEDNVLDAETIFVSISLFNILKFPFSMLPSMISRTMQAQVSLSRIELFLTKSELETGSVERSTKDDCSVHIKDGNFAWSPEDNLILKNIYLQIRPGSLVAVVGHVGCGKSSLLSAMLGEMEKRSGTVHIKDSVAYVPQQAWIQNATLRDNVLFGAPIEDTIYQEVIEKCALAPDLEMLPAGDLTEIGEKGINLSGGQKQRVSLARAVYNDANIYLMDDPLSAVDAHVGRHIFDHVIGPHGLLKRKTRILVTHGVNFLPQVDHIVVIVNGEITEAGSYSELLSRDQAFAEFLRNYSTDANEDIPDKESETTKATTSPAVQKDAHQGKVLSTAVKSQQEEEELRMKIAKDQLKKQLEQDAKKAAGKASEGDTLIQKEKSETGMTNPKVFMLYIRSLGYVMFLLIFLLYALFSIDSVIINVWLSRWSNEEASNDTTMMDDVRDRYLAVYGVLVFCQGVLLLLASMLLAAGVLRASRKIYLQLLTNILRSPMVFFDTTPTGRILNRFSKDVNVIDETIPFSCASFLRMMMQAVATFFVITWSTPIFGSVIVPLLIGFALLQRFYISASRQLKRIDSVTRSPIYSHFSESITGASSIRAYNCAEQFMLRNQTLVDANQVTYYPNIISNRWLGVRLEFLGSCVVFFAALFAVNGRDHLSAGIVGLSISYALEITSTMTMMVRSTCNLETNIVAVERVEEYCRTPTEAPAIVEGNRPKSDWPDTGRVDISEYSVRYRDDLELVLRGISCHIEPGEKIGIVGRTGAGKTSLSMALFRILEAASGSIKIDDLDISSIGLDDLRSRITIIPQDPVLFAGTLRMNIDPFDLYSDDEIWNVLRHSHLHSLVTELPEKLHYTCSEGGSNLSLGQRQLVCLARALLRKSKILVLDEATAAVDLETDDLIQATIRREFDDSTVITIAHRLNTIMDNTRIMVLDAGVIAQFDTPAQLLKEGGIFSTMAKDAGLA